MSSNNTEQRLGAAKEASTHILAQQAQYRSLIERIRSGNAGLANSYQGTGASTLTQVVSDWADSADALVREFEGFAQRMVDTDKTTAASQEEQTSTFSRSRTTFRTSI